MLIDLQITTCHEFKGPQLWCSISNIQYLFQQQVKLVAYIHNTQGYLCIYGTTPQIQESGIHKEMQLKYYVPGVNIVMELW